MISFSYSPKTSTALSNVMPVKKSAALSFDKNSVMELLKQNPEIVAEGNAEGQKAITSGIISGTESLMGSLLGALKKKSDEKAATDASATEFERQKEIAEIYNSYKKG